MLDQEYRALSDEERNLLRELVQSDQYKILDRLLLSHLEACSNDALNKDSYVDVYRAQGGYRSLNGFRSAVIDLTKPNEEE